MQILAFILIISVAVAFGYVTVLNLKEIKNNK